MKKIGKEKLAELIKNRGEKTFKQLSEETGYHEKSLIRLSKQLKNNTYSYVHKSKGKKPNNYINDNIRKDIVDMFSNKSYETYKDFYNDLSKRYKVSYSFLCSLIGGEEDKNREEVLILTKYNIDDIIFYVAMDYQTDQLLMISTLKSDEDEMILTFLKTIIKKFGSPKYVLIDNYFKEIPIYIQRILKIYGIKNKNIDKGLSKAINKRKKFIEESKIKSIYTLYSHNDISYSQVEIKERDFYYHMRTSLERDNLLFIEDNNYLVLSDVLHKSGTIVDVFYNRGFKDLYLIIKGIKYEVKEL